MVKNPPANAGDLREAGWIPGESHGQLACCSPRGGTQSDTAGVT